ncbi:S-adenosyl methyltransferase [Sinosporangium album]|uniref:S-adenosyl methyltransferase n=1 Tax=Sinosporangium album TaxID=504805 RepID=A0A1G7Z2R0_9ACTN|nr:SAM-dependent methyltransferase [Sinosporangium album]SDH03018.1 S-adenosyl methyltransferase [Sinosporangium album]
MSQNRNPSDSEKLNPEIAHSARVWNYWLGGKDHYPSDREVGDHVSSLHPNIAHVARADRAFLGRVVHYLAADIGIRQFLDIGTGLPTVDNTHEIAQRVSPDSRVVYVDNDPLVLVHARALLTSTPEGATDYIEADLHDPKAILTAAEATLDFDKPVGIMLLGILNFILDDGEAAAVVRQLLDRVPSGSYVAVTHPTFEIGGEANIEGMRFWNENATPKIRARGSAEIARFFDGLELLEPGVVSCAHWRPDLPDIADQPPAVPQYGAVGLKP